MKWKTWIWWMEVHKDPKWEEGMKGLVVKHKDLKWMDGMKGLVVEHRNLKWMVMRKEVDYGYKVPK